MRCALAAMGFVNGDVRHNAAVIVDTLRKYAAQADIVLFGEAFLQGFYAATFDPAHDNAIALMQDAPMILEIRAAARQYATAVAFGFIEKAAEAFYSSYITIGPDGAVLDLYRRISPGWKEPFAGPQYREGEAFHTFPYMGKRIAVALCGDLWYDENITLMQQLQPDTVFWPVYTDFDYREWNTATKHEYAQQAAAIPAPVLYVNSLCKDKPGDEYAKGGAAHFAGGSIVREIPAVAEGVMVVDI